MNFRAPAVSFSQATCSNNDQMTFCDIITWTERNIFVINTMVSQVYIEEHYPFLSNLLKTLQDMMYDKSKVELVILSLVDNDLVNKWDPQGFEKFTHLQEVKTFRICTVRAFKMYTLLSTYHIYRISILLIAQCDGISNYHGLWYMNIHLSYI